MPRPGAPEVLDFIPYFVARELGLSIQRPEHLEHDYLNTLAAITSAPSKPALLHGFPHPSTPRQVVRIRLDRFSEELSQIRGHTNETWTSGRGTASL
jgi:hypothetical protein